MQPRVDWVLIILQTQVIKKKQPVRPVFPDYLSISYDYGVFESNRLERLEQNIQKQIDCKRSLTTKQTNKVDCKIVALKYANRNITRYG